MAHRTLEPDPDRGSPAGGATASAIGSVARAKPRLTPVAGVRRALRRACLTLAVFSVCVNILLLAIPAFIVQVFDRVITSRSDDTLLVLTVAAVLAVASLVALDLVRARLMVRVGIWLDQNLSGSLFATTLRRTSPFQWSPSQAVRDLSRVRTFLASPGVLPLLDAPWIPLFVGVVFLIHPMLGGFAVVGVLLLLAAAYANERLTRAPFRRAALRQRKTLAVVDCMSRYGDAIAANGMVGALTRWWGIRHGHILDTHRLASDRAGTLVAVIRFLRLSLQILVLAVAAWLVIQQQLSVGAMVAAFLILGFALAPIERVVRIWGQWQKARAAFRRLSSALDRCDDKVGTTSAWRPVGNLEVTNAAFSPRKEGTPLFEGMSFNVAPGEILGIVGPSGIGKTTLARMLVGLVAPSQGRVRLDGRDMTHLNAGGFGGYVGFVPQSVELLPGSVRDNIARFFDTPAATVVAAAKAAGIHEMVMDLPDGYDTAVGGPDDVLSAGTRQRVALARALFGDPRLLVLDEPYSNLDDDGIQALMTAMETARARQATVVIVAHRASLLARADTVLHMERGGHRLLDRDAWAQLRVVRGEGAVATTSKIPAPLLPTVRRSAPARRTARGGEPAPVPEDD